MKIAIIYASPRINGTSDQIGNLFIKNLKNKNHIITEIFLRDYEIKSCKNCNFCSTHKNLCSINDQANHIFNLINDSEAIFISSPIYFYALPSHFKALIDRSQYKYKNNDNININNKIYKPCIISLVSGRKKGKELFKGSLLSLKYFLNLFDYSIIKKCLFRGIENPENMSAYQKKRIKNLAENF